MNDWANEVNERRKPLADCCGGRGVSWGGDSSGEREYN